MCSGTNGIGDLLMKIQIEFMIWEPRGNTIDLFSVRIRLVEPQLREEYQHGTSEHEDTTSDRVAEAEG